MMQRVAAQSWRKAHPNNQISLSSLSALRAIRQASTHTCDVAIIGGGVIGAACALELRRAGFTTINVDAGPSPGYGSTSSSSAIVRCFYSNLESSKLAWEGLHVWKAWPDYLRTSPSTGEELCQLYQIGLAAMRVPDSPHNEEVLSNISKCMAAIGCECDEWSAEELSRHLPFISTESYYPPRKTTDDAFGETNGSLSGAFFTQNAGYVSDPQLAARNLADAAMREKAKFLWKSPVTGIQLDDSRTRVQGLTLEDGTAVSAPVVVNAAGPHSAVIHALAFSKAAVKDDSIINSRPLRVEVAYVPGPRDIDLDRTMPICFDMDVGVYLRPQQGGQLVIGSIEPECDELVFLDKPEDLNAAMSDRWTELLHRACLRMPSLPIPSSASGLVAMYDVTQDWTPLYDRTALRGFYSMRGTSGNQFKNAGVVGKILTQLVNGCENGVDHDQEPIELPLEYTGGSINLRQFSRLRELATSSGSVLG